MRASACRSSDPVEGLRSRKVDLEAGVRPSATWRPRSPLSWFIELASGVTSPTGMVEAVYRRTEGNPLFVTEVVRLLVQDGHLAADHGRGGSRTAPTGTGHETWSVRIPEGVREVIGRRLDRLSDRCNETLTIASVVVREFTLEQLSPLIEDPSAGSGQAMTGDRPSEVLDEALSARVIEELPRAVGRYQFTRALIRETLTGELTTTRKVRLHARIAEALEKLYGADAEVHAAELAHHFAEAATHFEHSLAFCWRAGYRPKLAWTCCDYADALLKRGNEGDQAKANALLDESLALSRDLGMRPLMERVRSRR